MNSKERVLATLNRQPVDRTPLDCWLYQRQFVIKPYTERVVKHVRGRGVSYNSVGDGA